MGDTFDRRKYVNFYTLKRTKEMFFDKLKEANIQVDLLAGNHDTYFKNTNDVNSVDLLLKEYDNLNIIDEPMDIQIGNHTINMIPWICVDNYEQALDSIKNTKASICCGHFEIAGFSMYRGHPSEEGLNRDIFRKFDFTFSGHFHHKSSADDIHYLGNPYELTWQDFNDDRGFHIFDLDTRELNFVRNPNRMFHRIIYDDKAESVTDINGKDLSVYKTTYVKVVVVNKSNPYLFDRFMENLYSNNPIDITIAEDFTDVNEFDDDDIVNQAEDTLTILSKYIDGLTTDLKSDKLKGIMREIYVESLNAENQ